MTDLEHPLLVVVGPTASGKTELAIRLAEYCSGEIISADSVQIYRKFDIGSAKPSLGERQRAPHHLLDELDALHQTADAAQFVDLADAKIATLRAKGVPVIVCGGTFLWVRALLYGLAQAPAADPAIRRRHTEEAERYGRPALHARLRDVDPASAARLAPNDLQRVSRALEVFELTGSRLSEIQQQHGFRTPRYDARLIAIDYPREELWARIEGRAHAMFRAGLVEEVRDLLSEGYGEAPVFRAVGYRQVAEALASGTQDEPETQQSVVRATKRLVRHQMTWLRSQDRIRWIPPSPNRTPGDLLRELSSER